MPVGNALECLEYDAATLLSIGRNAAAQRREYLALLTFGKPPFWWSANKSLAQGAAS